MITPTKILSDEHQDILKMIKALARQVQKLKSGKKLDKRFFEKAIEFIKNYADKFHHAKEEEILFKELCKPGVQVECNPVRQMLFEHDLGRNFVKTMEQGLKEDNKEKIQEGTEGYAQLLSEHIFKEDNILYPMADKALDEKTKSAILEKFKQKEKSNQKIKEEYLSIIKDLK